MSANTSNKELESARVEYVAAAGLQTALWRAQNNTCMGDVTIPDTPLGNDKYSATITGAAAGTLYELAADQDAWIRNDDPTRNNGKTAANHIRQETGKVEQVLTRFDLSTLPAKGQILSAVAWFNLKVTKEHPEGPISVHEIAADWSETSVTWDSFAGAYRSAVVGMIPAQDTGNVWVGVNLTGLVQAWVNGQPNHGILMQSLAEGVHAEYLAREDGTNPPRLDVVVGSGDASPVIIKAKGELDNGVGRTLNDKSAVAYQPPVSAVLQPGSEGKDGAVRSGSPNDNYGAAVELRVAGGADPEHALIQFPVERIPAGSRIASARMEVYLTWLGSSDPAAEFSVHPMNEAWTEGTGDSWNPGDGANWNTANGIRAWDWQSNHGVANPVDTTVVDPSYSGWHSWDITGLAQQWSSDGRENFGVVIKGNANVANAWFRSSDFSDASQHPRLIVEFACECGSPCMALQDSGSILMVVNEKTSLNPDDEVIKSTLESWGYTIELISAKDNSNTFNGGFVRNDVVFVAESINSNELGNKVNSAPIGVVNTDGWMNDELGFESDNSSNWPVGNSINVTDVSHYITAPLAAGSLAIYDAGMGGLAIGNTPAPGLQSLATWGSDTGLAVLESGALLATGGSAAGRRVMLPFGRDNSMDWSRLNNSGQLILQRALSWGMNTKGALRVLLVVGIDTALQTRDTARRNLFESWGHTVTIIDDEADQSEFDAAVALNDVVYVAGTVVDGRLADKLTKSTLGIVNEVGGQLDDLGFHGNATANTALSDNFGATHAGHYISEPFGGSAVTHFNTFVSMPVASAPLAPVVGTIASLGALTWAIPVLDTGAARWDGELSAGRRVNLPFGEAEISQVTDDGQTLMRRSIEWAAGANTTATPLLLVVADAASPSTSETDRKSLIESWGYEVTLISDHASQAEFDAALANVDVAYITGSGSSTAVGTKLTGATVGVLSEDIGLVDELGIAQPSFLKRNSQSIDIFDNTHYVTSGFSLGTLQLYSYVPGIWTVTGLYAPGLQILAGTESSGSSFPPGLAFLEAGAELWGGGSAAGRRVQVPWSEGTFDINRLNADGLTIFQRAIEWGAGAGSASTGPIAHWKLDDGTGLTAIDSENGHDGTLANGPAWVTGQLGDALNFDGSNDRINVPHDSGLDLVSQMTLSAWIHADTLGPFQMVLTKGDNGTDENYWLGTETNRVNFGFVDGGTYAQHTTSGLEIGTGSWHHIAATFDDIANEVSIYVDGVPETFANSYTPAPNSERLIIGNSYYGEGFEGVIDDVRIYDRVLNAADIAELATPAAIGLTAHWKLDDGTGVTAVDSIGGHDGTLINGPAWVAGQIGDALDFDGSNDLVSVPHQAIFTQAPMTVSAWFKLNTLPTTRSEHGTIIDKRHTVDPYASWTLYVNESLGNKIRFQIRDSSETGYWLDSAASAVANTWYHVVGTIDESYNAKLYVNGVLEPDDDNIGSLFSSNDEIRIGAGWSGGNRLDGVVDDVRFYDRALSAAEISGLYTAGTGGGGGGGGPSSCIFRDEFENQSYGNQDGNAQWAGDWQEVNDGGSSTGGDIRLEGGGNPGMSLRIQDDDRPITRAADLSGHTSATLTLEYKRVSLENGEYAALSIYDGSTWTELAQFGNPPVGNDSNFQSYTEDISAYISPNFQIRLATPDGGMGNSDDVKFDNLQIEASGGTSCP